MARNTAQKKNNKPETPDTPDPLEDLLLQQAEEDLRQEKLKAVWNEYGNWVIGAVVLVVLGTAVSSLYGAWISNRNATRTDTVLAAVDSSNVIIPETISSAHDVVLAMIEADSSLEDAPDISLNTYEMVANSGRAPEHQKYIAQWNQIRLEAQSASNEDLPTYVAALRTLTDNESNPYRAQIALDAAVLAGERLQNYGMALELLQIAESSFQQFDPAMRLVNDLRTLYTLLKTESDSNFNQGEG